jgi:hypothetical protein
MLLLSSHHRPVLTLTRISASVCRLCTPHSLHARRHARVCHLHVINWCANARPSLSPCTSSRVYTTPLVSAVPCGHRIKLAHDYTRCFNGEHHRLTATVLAPPPRLRIGVLPRYDARHQYSQPRAAESPQPAHVVHLQRSRLDGWLPTTRATYVPLPRDTTRDRDLGHCFTVARNTAAPSHSVMSPSESHPERNALERSC